MMNQDSDNGTNKDKDMKRNKIRPTRTSSRSERNFLGLKQRERENGLGVHAFTRSKTQEFEDKYRIAAARCNGQESPSVVLRPSPVVRSNKQSDKNIVRLPLFRININNFVGNSEISKTREYLRKLMELHKSKPHESNVVAASIRNYEFSTPLWNTRKGVRASVMQCPVSQPVYARSSLRSSLSSESRLKQPQLLSRQLHTSGISNFDNEYTSISDTKTFSEIDNSDSNALNKGRLDLLGPEGPQDDSMVSLIWRPDTALTLGSTISQLESAINSQSLEELQKLSRTFHINESQPVWPSADDVHQLKTRNVLINRKVQTANSRRGAKQHNVIEYGCEHSDVPNGNRVQCLSSLERIDGHKPVLRYTSKSTTLKLDPIIVPSHTCTECPMCNIYQGDYETLCPPNTPTSEQCTIEVNSNLKVPYITAIKWQPRPESMNISRININRSLSPEEQSVINYMKAS